MSLFKKKKTEKTEEADKAYTLYLGKATFYHNNGTAAVTESGSYSAEHMKWIKDNIGRDAIWQCKNGAINLKYFYEVQFEVEGAE